MSSEGFTWRKKEVVENREPIDAEKLGQDITDLVMAQQYAQIEMLIEQAHIENDILLTAFNLADQNISKLTGAKVHVVYDAHRHISELREKYHFHDGSFEKVPVDDADKGTAA